MEFDDTLCAKGDKEVMEGRNISRVCLGGEDNIGNWGGSLASIGEVGSDRPAPPPIIYPSR